MLVLKLPYWVLSGSYDNWVIGLEKKVWGVKEKAKPLWEKVELGDIVVFYATGKVGILGYGIVLEKFVDHSPLWPEEVKQGKAIWPYRMRIKVKKLFSKPKPRPKNMLVRLGINKLDEETFKKIK